MLPAHRRSAATLLQYADHFWNLLALLTRRVSLKVTVAMAYSIVLTIQMSSTARFTTVYPEMFAALPICLKILTRIQFFVLQAAVPLAIVVLVFLQRHVLMPFNSNAKAIRRALPKIIVATEKLSAVTTQTSGVVCTTIA